MRDTLGLPPQRNCLPEISSKYQHFSCLLLHVRSSWITFLISEVKRFHFLGVRATVPAATMLVTPMRGPSKGGSRERALLAAALGVSMDGQTRDF